MTLSLPPCPSVLSLQVLDIYSTYPGSVILLFLYGYNLYSFFYKPNLFMMRQLYCMRKGREGGKKGGGTGRKKKRLIKITATTSFANSLPPEQQPLERRTLVPKF